MTGLDQCIPIGQGRSSRLNGPLTDEEKREQKRERHNAKMRRYRQRRMERTGERMRDGYFVGGDRGVRQSA